MSGASDSQIAQADDVANIARSLALDGSNEEGAVYMLRAAAGDDALVLQLAQGMLMPLATASPPGAGAADGLRFVSAARRELAEATR